MNKKTHKIHRFIDEAGDCTFFGKGKEVILGKDGVSLSFILGMVKINQDLGDIRQKIGQKALEIENSNFYKKVPSVQKRIQKYGKFIFHAKDDIPEIRKEFFDLLLNFDFSLQAVVGKKIPSLFVRKHNSSETEFYADLLSHLLKDKFNGEKLVLNIAQRGKSTNEINLQLAIEKAQTRYLQKNTLPGKAFVFHGDAVEKSNNHQIVFNVQPYNKEPLLSIADYTLWAVQRVFQTGETRFYDYLIDKIRLVIDLYDYQDTDKPKWYNYYNKNNPLTEENKISPSSS
jgi:hypothetical protein